MRLVVRRLGIVLSALGLRFSVKILMGLNSMLLTASWQVTILSRNANNGTNDSAFYLNANNDSANQNRNIGTQLAGSLNKRGLSNSSAHAQIGSPITLSSLGEQRGGYQQ